MNNITKQRNHSLTSSTDVHLRVHSRQPMHISPCFISIRPFTGANISGQTFTVTASPAKGVTVGHASGRVSESHAHGSNSIDVHHLNQRTPFAVSPICA
jgi:hypothetical protein